MIKKSFKSKPQLADNNVRVGFVGLAKDCTIQQAWLSQVQDNVLVAERSGTYPSRLLYSWLVVSNVADKTG
jgi:hypothetical protein